MIDRRSVTFSEFVDLMNSGSHAIFDTEKLDAWKHVGFLGSIELIEEPRTFLYDPDTDEYCDDEDYMVTQWAVLSVPTVVEAWSFITEVEEPRAHIDRVVEEVNKLIEPCECEDRRGLPRLWPFGCRANLYGIRLVRCDSCGTGFDESRKLATLKALGEVREAILNAQDDLGAVASGR